MRNISIALNSLALMGILVAGGLIFGSRPDIVANAVREPEDLLIVNLLSALLAVSFVSSILNLIISARKGFGLLALVLNVVLALAMAALTVISLMKHDPDWPIWAFWCLPYAAGFAVKARKFRRRLP